MADGLFTLPPSPDELEAEADRERVRTDRDEAMRGFRQRSSEAWQKVPELFRDERVPDLLGHIKSSKLRHKVNSAVTISAVLIGPSGCGKSVAAAILVRRALAEFVQSEGKRFAQATDIEWISASELAMAERRHPLGDGAPMTLNRASSCGLLVLDDIGHEASGESLFPVIDARYTRKLPTIATSGLPRLALTKHLSAAGVRRLNEQHAGFPVLLVDAHEHTPKPPSKPPGGQT